MKYRTLGKTGLNVSEIGYGTWQFANDDEFWVGASRKESEASLLAAIDNGVNYIDTARVYGDGLSEQWIGEILKKRPNNEIIISSKVFPKNFKWPAPEGIEIKDVFPKEHIIKLVDESLKALDVDSIDVMFFHVWQDAWANEDEWKETVTNIIKQGKVKFWGISTNDYQSANCIKACDTGLITVIQTIFNLFFQEPTDSLLPYVKENNIGLVARVPLDEGGLSGKINTQSKFPEGDFRNTYFSPERLVELEKRINELQKIVDESNEVESIPEMALRYLLSFDEVTSIIPGMRKLNHVKQNTQLSDKGGLSAELIESLKSHIWNRNFYL